MKKQLFPIVANNKIFYIISLVIIVAGAVSIAVQGFNLDIDFTGGTSMSVEIGKELDSVELDNIEDIATQTLGFAPSVVQKAGDSSSMVVIKTREIDTTQRDALFNAIKEAYSLEADGPDSSDNISATIGRELTKKSFIAVAIAAVLMLIYIWIRFELVSGIAAVAALLHDVFVMLTAYSLFRIPMNITFIAAMLTIVGYSINATIIVFDRVRENRKFNHKEDFAVSVETSVWQTATRSLNTTLTTLFTVVMIFIMGVTSIRNFALPLIIGIVAGLYSSLMIAPNIWVSLRRMGIGKKSGKL